jgi:hypothetical protein
MPILPRSDSTAEFQPLEDKEVEYFFASDASAVIEHTNRVIFLEVSHSFDHKSWIFKYEGIVEFFMSIMLFFFNYLIFIHFPYCP